MLKAFDKWLAPWMWQSFQRTQAKVTDVMLAVCDHFEPFHRSDKAGATNRMKAWQDQLPAIAAAFRDHDGQGPRHTFFYPIEQYDPDILHSLATLCGGTQNEVEVHLHHDRDNPENLARSLSNGKIALREHGLLGENKVGDIVFGFIHGNWALDDSDPSGDGCGVRGELAILKQQGCYADFTMPSAPHPTQVPLVNQLYYATSTSKGCSHHSGRPVATGINQTTHLRDDPQQLLLVQGPLALDFKRRKFGILPRLENADLGPQNPPTVHRMRLWLKCSISVRGMESWQFIKLHTHGAPEHGHRSNLGEERIRFHAQVQEFADAQGFRLHYVSAREMVNIMHAAEDGHSGDAGAWRNYLYTPPPLLRTA